MTSPNLVPQPGAKKNPMLSLGMPLRDVTEASWPDLEGKNAVNFISIAHAFVFPKGETLYRVYGGAANMKGAYWSPEPPAPGSTEGDWRGSNAIEYNWNAGENVASYTAQNDIKLWKGGVESQPAQSMDGNILPDYWLVGGGTQFFFPFWLIDGFTPVACGATPWQATASTSTPVPDALVATAGDFDPADKQALQAFRVGLLADALRASAEILRQTPTATAQDAEALEGARANLMKSANSILSNIGSDPARVNTEVRSQVGLARYLVIDATLPGGDTAGRLLNDVIAGAAELSGKA